MPGWESVVRVTPAVAWGNPGGLSRRGMFLYADSVNLDMGAQVAERDGKMMGVRELPQDVFSIDRYYPKGNITFQPRVDDVLMFLMAHFQNCVKAGGTYNFFRIPFSPDFSQLPSGTGTYWVGSSGTYGASGTNVYSINVDHFYAPEVATGTGANGARFTNGIVEKLTFTQKFGEDLGLEAEIKFLAGSWYAYGTNFDPQSTFGSYSAYSRFVDYLGTITVNSESYDLVNWTAGFNNNSVDRGKIGKQGWQRYPFAGRYVADGSFDMELLRDLNILKEGSHTSITIDFFNSSTSRIYINQPNIVYRPFSISESGGDTVIEVSKGYRAMPPAGTYLALGSLTWLDMPSTIVSVVCGTEFGTALFGF
jgi:hypothetical protein